MVCVAARTLIVMTRIPCTLLQTVDIDTSTKTGMEASKVVQRYFVRKDRMPDALWGVMHRLNSELVTGVLIETLVEVLEMGRGSSCRRPWVYPIAGGPHAPDQVPAQLCVVDLVTILTRGPTTRGADLELGGGFCSGMSEGHVRALVCVLANIAVDLRDSL